MERLTNESAGSAAAAINRFLSLSDYMADLDRQIAEWHGEELIEGKAPKDLFQRLSTANRSAAEVRQIMRKSMLANVIRIRPGGIKKPKKNSIKSPKVRTQIDDYADFPAEFVMPLFDAANCYRDLAAWSLMAGAGLRHSEVSQLHWEAIDIEAQQVFVYDPESHRYADELPEEYVPRFKGRQYSETYIIPQLREVFFEALANYVRFERRPREPDFMVFQDITSTGNGRPYSLVSARNIHRRPAGGLIWSLGRVSRPRRAG